MAKATKTTTKKSKAPEPGYVVTPRREDFGNYFQLDLTPERAKRILRAAADGDPFEQNVLFDEMLETDDRLASVYGTRKMAVCELQYEILSAMHSTSSQVQVDKSLKNLADEAADFVREVFEDLVGYTAAREHLADAIGRGTTVTEVRWETVNGKRRPVELVPVLGTQLCIHPQEPQRLRVRTPAEPYKGLALDEEADGKFIIHQPRTLGGSFFRGGELRGSVVAHMVKRHGRKGWWFGIEAFGLPITVVKHDMQAGELGAKEKAEILLMLKNLGIGRGGLFPKGCELEFVEFSATGQWPHERLLAYIDAGYSIQYLGQTLTTQNDQGGGSNAMAVTHNEVRKDIRNNDAAKQDADWRLQLIRPLVLNQFGERVLKVIPFHRLNVDEPKDIAVQRENIRTAVIDLDMPVPMSHAVETLGVPVCEGTDLNAPIPGNRNQGGSPSLGDLFSANRAPLPRNGTVVANKAAAKKQDVRETLVAWSKSAAAFEARSESNINRLIEKLSAGLAALPEDAGIEDAASVISAVLPEVDFTDMEQVIGALVEASLLAGAADVTEGAK
jgi:phage gp29-like protein